MSQRVLLGVSNFLAFYFLSSHFIEKQQMDMREGFLKRKVNQFQREREMDGRVMNVSGR